MKERIYFRAEVRSGKDFVHLPAYAVTCPDGVATRAERLARSIAFHSGLDVVTLRPDGWKEDSDHYVLTLGRRVHGGGWEPKAEVWFSIAREPSSSTQDQG